MDRVSVLIYDSAKYIQGGYYDDFTSFPEIEVTAKAYTYERCLELARRTFPDLLIFDINNEPQSPHIISEIKKICPNIKIIILSESISDTYIFQAFADGADNYCEKSLAHDEILKIIKNTFTSANSLNPEIAKKLISRTREVNQNQQSLLYMYNKISHLTKGEFDLLHSLYNGESYSDIAKRKVVEVASVRKMASRLLKRMGAGTMDELLDILHNLQIFEFMDMGKLQCD